MAAPIEDHPEMTDELTSFAFVSKKTQEFLRPFLVGSAKGHELGVLCASWKKALETGALVSKPDSVTFQVLNGADPAVTLCAVLKPNTREDSLPWFLTYAGRDSHGILASVKVEDESAPHPAPVAPPVSSAKDLKSYAFMWVGRNDASHANALEQIAARALPEPWGFGEGDWSILYNYIVQTFYKLRCDGLVLETEDRSFAAMNSGLVTPRYEDLYLCFTPNRLSSAKQPWEFAGVCTQFDNSSEAAKRLSARLRKAFPDMPQRAKFFSDVSDIVFDASREIICNWDHIIIENVDRIPTDFLANQLYGRQAAQIRALVESIDYDPDKGGDGDPFGDHAKGLAGEQFDELRAFLEASPMHFNRIKDAMQGALERSIKRAAYSFRTGVPSFYPTINKIQILLPLCLLDEDEPDCALVTSKDDWGDYEGRTILTLRMAYNNARLLCRPESEWLSV